LPEGRFDVIDYELKKVCLERAEEVEHVLIGLDLIASRVLMDYFDSRRAAGTRLEATQVSLGGLTQLTRELNSDGPGEPAQAGNEESPAFAGTEVDEAPPVFLRDSSEEPAQVVDADRLVAAVRIPVVTLE
jgi:hypothetical protein